MKATIDMTQTVSASDAQARLGTILKWAEENRDGVIIERRGKPAGVLISYTDYVELEKLRRQETKRQALEVLREIRNQIQESNPDVDAEEAYRMAGFGDEAIASTLEMDKELANAEQ